MAVCDLSKGAGIIFPVLILNVLMVMFHQAYGSSRGPSSLANGITLGTSTVGICASSVISQGYKCQEIYVKTQDGYILNVQRIPEGRVESGHANRQPVLLQHGVLVDGITWLLNSPQQNLPLILADQGFDVWISNTRGTKFSTQHTSLLPNQAEYWNWSWDELAKFDLSAVIDYVYNQTGQKIHYIGHSQGTLIALVSFSEGRLVDKLKSAALLSPIAYLSNVGSPVALAASLLKTLTPPGSAKFDPLGKPFSKLLATVCAAPGVNCSDLLSVFSGKNCCLNASAVDLFFKNEPQPSSTKNMVHFGQTIQDGVVAKFDYGSADMNMKYYGQAKPPVYNLSNIPQSFPLFLSYGGLDTLSDVPDVQHLLQILKLHDADKLTVQYIKNYAHLDFIMGWNAKDIVYNQVVSFFKSQH